MQILDGAFRFSKVQKNVVLFYYSVTSNVSEAKERRRNVYIQPTQCRVAHNLSLWVRWFKIICYNSLFLKLL